jgi:hypothetical protein
MKIPERKMCLNEWHTINFSAVPSRCMFINKKAFARHDPERWAEFEAALADGTATVNAQLFPHDLCYQILQGGQNTHDAVAQKQWDTLKAKVAKEFAEIDLSGVMVMSDVSGSMTCAAGGKTKVRCLDVSVGLGLFFAELLPKPWKDMVLTFSSRPEFHKIKGTTLYERLTNLKGAHWEMSTNLQGALDLMLSTAVRNKVPAKDMPSTLLIISDMQFNPTWSGSYGSERTNLAMMRRKYESAGYPMPVIVFWNVNAQPKDFPAQADMDSVAMLSGFSPSILRLVFTGEVNPVNIVKNAISDPRYEVINQRTPVDWKKFLYADFEPAEKKRKVQTEEAMEISNDEDLKVVIL